MQINAPAGLQRDHRLFFRVRIRIRQSRGIPNQQQEDHRTDHRGDAQDVKVRLPAVQRREHTGQPVAHGGPQGNAAQQHAGGEAPLPRGEPAAYQGVGDGDHQAETLQEAQQQHHRVVLHLGNQENRGQEQHHGEQEGFPPAEVQQHAPFEEAADGVAGHQRGVAGHHLGGGQTKRLLERRDTDAPCAQRDIHHGQKQTAYQQDNVFVGCRVSCRFHGVPPYDS